MPFVLGNPAEQKPDYGEGRAIVQSPILGTTKTSKRLKQLGSKAMLEVYIELNLSFYEPPYTRNAWFTMSEAEVYGGVRGTLRQFLAESSTRL